jgi:two-component system NarL family sensor kinase
MTTHSALESEDPGTLLSGERKVLELIATGAPLGAVLDALCRVIDAESGLRSSVFLLDAAGERLTLAAGPHLPQTWRAAVASFPVTLTACGAAVTRREQIVSPDIATDPLYAGFHDEARKAGIGAVWSTPFFSNGRPLGTFAVYSSAPGPPSDRDLALVRRATHLASIAVDRHLTEQGLRESEIRFSRAFYANPACMAIWSFADGRLLYVNDAFVRMFGHSRTETIGQSAMSLGLYADPGQRPVLIQRLLEGPLHEMEAQGRTKSGDILDLIVSMERIELLGEQRVLSIATDITRRKRAEEAVRVSERRWRSVFDNSAIGILTGDATLRITGANRAVQDIDGYSERELTRLTFLEVTHPDDRHLVERATADLLAGRARECQIEKRHLCKDGRVAWVRATMSLIHEANESPRCLVLLEDISARKAMEQELAQSLTHLRALAAKLVHAQDGERRRIALMLHETTAQDLAALKMLLARLHRTGDGLSDPDRAALHETIELADHSMRDIRTLAYLLHPPFLDDTGLLSAVRWYAQGFAGRSGINVDLDLPAALDRLPQDVETTLFRVVQEALINIHRHAGSATARIRLRTTADQLTLEIEDQGHGMSPDVVARLTKGVGALGVGVASMRERLKQVDGALDITSSPRGTLVRATVPLHESPDE